jgi:hypothetical protein
MDQDFTREHQQIREQIIAEQQKLQQLDRAYDGSRNNAERERVVLGGHRNGGGGGGGRGDGRGSREGTAGGGTGDTAATVGGSISGSAGGSGRTTSTAPLANFDDGFTGTDDEGDTLYASAHYSSQPPIKGRTLGGVV